MEESTRKRAFDEHGRYLPRYRMFIVSEGDAEAERRSGIGVTAEHVIADWQDLFRGWHDQNATERGEGLHEGVTDAELADGFLDCVVWDITAGAKVVAVMRPDPTGKRELVVTRFDGAPRPAVPTEARRGGFAPGEPVLTFE